MKISDFSYENMQIKEGEQVCVAPSDVPEELRKLIYQVIEDTETLAKLTKQVKEIDARSTAVSSYIFVLMKKFFSQLDPEKAQGFRLDDCRQPCFVEFEAKKNNGPEGLKDLLKHLLQ